MTMFGSSLIFKVDEVAVVEVSKEDVIGVVRVGLIGENSLSISLVFSCESIETCLLICLFY